MAVVAASIYARPELALVLCPLACYFALSAGIIAHNHNHCPTFRARLLNDTLGAWLSVFYGYPTFAWIPTHNLNHHKLVNKAGDATITWRYTNAHNFLVAATFFFVSSYWQSDPIKAYIRKARETNPRLFRKIIGQYAVWAGAHLGLIALAVALHGVRQGLFVWTLAFLVPALFALWSIMFFNYVQHVHADPWSAHDHSRNFTGRLLNQLMFNNGYHTAHHEAPGAHWSTLSERHEQLAREVHAELLVRGFWAWCFRVYVLAPFVPRFGTRQIGRAPFDPPSGAPPELAFKDPIEAVEAGVNAART